MKHVKNFIIAGFVAIGAFAAFNLFPAQTLAASASSEVCSAIGSGANCDDPGGGTGEKGASLFSIIRWVTKILSIIVGIIAVIMIIIGGLRYITSGGDTGKVATAKNTIIYALIGLFVVGVAQLLVNLTLRESNTATKPPTSTTP